MSKHPFHTNGKWGERNNGFGMVGLIGKVGFLDPWLAASPKAQHLPRQHTLCPHFTQPFKSRNLVGREIIIFHQFVVDRSGCREEGWANLGRCISALVSSVLPKLGSISVR